jgi:hypothetical protein
VSQWLSNRKLKENPYRKLLIVPVHLWNQSLLSDNWLAPLITSKMTS